MFRRRKKKRSLLELFNAATRWDRKYLESTIHAAYLFHGDGPVRQLIQRYLSKRNMFEFNAVNPHSKRVWVAKLMDSMLNSGLRDLRPLEGLVDGQEDIRCALITFTHLDWACVDTNIEFDLARAKQKVRNALPALNYVGCFEAGCYVNERFERQGHKGRLISFHCHLIVWAESQYKLDKIRQRNRHRFAPLLGNRSGVHIASLKRWEDVCAAVYYQAKLPNLAYRTVRDDLGKITQEKVKMPASLRYRLFCATQDHDISDFWLAGGEGSVILRRAVAEISQERRAYWSSPRGQREQLRFDRTPIPRRQIHAF